MESSSADYAEAFQKFADWVDSNEKRINSACHCCPIPQTQQQNGILLTTNSATTTTTTTVPTTPATANATILHQTVPNTPVNHPQTWKHVILYHQNLQNEVEQYGRQLSCELKRHLNEDKSLGDAEMKKSTILEERWHKLWLNSLEQLVVVERTKRCPKHNSTIIGKSASSPANKSISRPQRRRPISYPNNYERLEWDYQHTLSLTGCHKENGSQIDLDSIDEQVTKNLTEFGENYEVWFGKEDEIACVPLHSRPPSVEPAEPPEVAKAVVTSNFISNDDMKCNLLMLTTPSSMFSVDASRCSHKPRHNSCWRVLVPFLFAFALILFSAIFQEPHHVHRSYYHSQPPV